jgi:SAM-dependent methyltransferase
MTAAAEARIAPFLAQYRAIRRRDGHGAMSDADYRRLPDATPPEGNATEWRLRRESWLTLRHLLAQNRAGTSTSGGAALRVLDVGAGNGWLSNRLCGDGHLATALDCNGDSIDGLGACRVYDYPFPVVQADFDALPFAAQQFDVVVMNASLHYAPDPARTLAEAHRVAADGAVLVVMDSPLADDDRTGELMVERQLTDLERRFGVTPIRIGRGYLTLTLLDAAAAQLGRRGRFRPSRGPWSWRLRRRLQLRHRGHRPAAFGVWVAR